MGLFKRFKKQDREKLEGGLDALHDIATVVLETAIALGQCGARVTIS